MKKIILFIAVIIATYSTYAQNTFPTSGSVGIGTTSPAYPLDVNGVIHGNHEVLADGGLRVGSLPGDDVNGAPWYGLGFINNTVLGSVGNVVQLAGYWGINIQTQLGQMVILQNGNVGIGTTSPAAKLDVSGNINTSSYISSTLGYYMETTKEGINSNAGPGYLSFRSNNIDNRMVIDPNGNVGIGTTSPNSTLDIHGYMSVGGGSGNLDARGTAGNLSYLANSAQMVIGWNRTQSAGEADFISNQGSGGTGGFAFYNHDNSNNETQLMWLLGNGNLLIGKNTQLNSSYKLDVAGSVRANAITVNVSGADFVFDPVYKLMPLADVSKYVNDNHHLPGIASAKEMQVNGLNVGENQTKLLQKVEELTLYLIEKDKQLKSQQQQIANQQSQLDQLKNQLNALIKSLNK